MISAGIIYGEDTMKHQLPKTLPAFICHFIKPYKMAATIFILLAVLAGFWGPFNSLIIKYIINILPFAKDNINILFWPGVMIVLNFIIFDNFTWRTIGCISYKYQPIIKNQIISQTTNFVLGNSHQYFQDNLSGRIANQITILADNIELILHRISLDFIRGASVVLVSLIAAYQVNPIFFYTMFAWFLIFSFFSFFMSIKLVDLADKHATSDSIISGQLVDSIANVSNIRIFSRRPYEIRRMDKYLEISKKAFKSKEFFLLILNCVQGLLIATMIGVAVYFLIHLYRLDAISIGDFALIFGLTIELGHMIWYTMSRVDEFNQSVGKCRQSLAALIVKPVVQDQSDAQTLIVSKGEVRYENVKFHYKGINPLFENLSVTIEAGQKVGLVGYSGSGKSTFISLILRLYDVTDGRILIDRQDIKEVMLDSLHKNIAVIPQDPSLFHRSIMENIRYGKIESSDEEVINAAKRAHAFDFISRLPLSFNALVGERGVKLSGGQRQRIAIARAILKNAPILILDEATSQLDSITESDIQDSLWDLMQDKTTIVIAHRLSTLLHMDRIIVFDQGKIVGDGTHAELSAKEGLYKTLWDAQVGGFLPDQNGEDEDEE
jgi:ATP-binding cassette, subfamily B, bacterial